MISLLSTKYLAKYSHMVMGLVEIFDKWIVRHNSCVCVCVCVCVCLVTQSCPTLCDPVDCSPPGSSVHGFLQARILEWVAICYAMLCYAMLCYAMLSHFSRVQLCVTPIDGSPPGSPVPGILQARTLEWVAISFSSAWKWKVKVKLLSRVQLLATPWTAAYQAPRSVGFSRKEYWSGVPLPSLELPYRTC